MFIGRQQAEAIAKKYPVNFSKSQRELMKEMYNIFNTIFMLVIVFLALILSVTVNAAFRVLLKANVCDY